MSKMERKRVQLNEESRKRMQTLSREVSVRIEEMARIMAHALEIDIGGDVNLRFVQKSGGATGDVARGHNPIEIVCSPAGCGCYVDPPGFCEFPCGAAGPI